MTSLKQGKFQPASLNQISLVCPIQNLCAVDQLYCLKQNIQSDCVDKQDDLDPHCNFLYLCSV